MSVPATLMARLHYELPEEDGSECRQCHLKFSLMNRRRNCGRCGRSHCDKCISAKGAIGYDPKRVCALCADSLRSLSDFVRTYGVALIDNTCDLVGSVTFKAYSRSLGLNGTNVNLWMSQDLLLILWQVRPLESSTTQGFPTHCLEGVTEGFDTPEFHSRQRVSLCFCLTVASPLASRADRLFSLHFSGGRTFDLEAPSADHRTQFVVRFRELLSAVRPVALALNRNGQLDKNLIKGIALEQKRVRDLIERKTQAEARDIALDEKRRTVNSLRQKYDYHTMGS